MASEAKPYTDIPESSYATANAIGREYGLTDGPRRRIASELAVKDAEIAKLRAALDELVHQAIVAGVRDIYVIAARRALMRKAGPDGEEAKRVQPSIETQIRYR